MPRNLIGNDQLPEQLEWLGPTVRKWCEINRDYAEATGGRDTLYWYNERPNVGALAAAAWKAGIYAIEEYTALKRPLSPTCKGSGRIDLYLTNDDQDAIVEAKICWVSPRTELRTLRRKMKAACSDAKRDREGDQRIAAVFYVMRLRQERVHEKALSDEVCRIRATKPDGLAWSFPAATRNLQSDRPEHEGYVWPGVIMALQLTTTS